MTGAQRRTPPFAVAVVPDQGGGYGGPRLRPYILATWVLLVVGARIPALQRT